MSRLSIIRIIIVAFIFTGYASSWSAETEASVIILMLTTLFAIAYVAAEITFYIEKRCMDE